MHRLNNTKFYKLSLGIFLLQLFFGISSCYNFKNNYTGITFDPYVKETEPGRIDLASYTYENTKTMLTVVAKKFNKILIQDTYLRSKVYVKNFTYQHGSRISLYSGELAALINAENKNDKLTVRYGVLFSHYNPRIAENILLVLEAAGIANNIFPGTVDAINLMLSESNDLETLEENINILKTIKEKAAEASLSLGFILNGFNITDALALIDSYPRVFSEPNLVTLQLARNKYSDGLSPIEYFNKFKQQILDFRDSIKMVNSNAQVLSVTRWSSVVEGQQDIESFKSYWETVSAWAAEEKILTYLNEAFDTPWKKFVPPSEHMGWWRLSDDSKINLISGYVEKVSENEKRNANFLDGDTSSTISWIAGGGITFISIATLILVLVIYYVKKPRGLTADELKAFLFGAFIPTGEENISAIDNVNGLPYNKSLEIPKEKLRIDKKDLLGSGHFGLVFRGLLETDVGKMSEVAVKVSISKCPADVMKGLLYEIKIMSFLGNHPNLVVLKGAYTAELSRGVVHVATEICTLGSLQTFLRNCESNREDGTMQESTAENMSEMELTAMSSLSVPDMIRWSYEIACGMEYVEGKHVIHADLATRNILLTSDKTAKIADFGMSRHVANYTEYIKKGKDPLPWRWMAFESLKKMEFSSKSDVWSYGITLWEIFSMGDIPYPGRSCTPDFIDELMNGLRPKCPSFAQPKFYKLMRHCWDVLPTERPNFSELVGYTQNWLQTYESGNDNTEQDYMENSTLEMYDALN